MASSFLLWIFLSLNFCISMNIFCFLNTAVNRPQMGDMTYHLYLRMPWSSNIFLCLSLFWSVGLSFLVIWTSPFSIFRVFWWMFSFHFNLILHGKFSSTADSDQKLHLSASELGLHCCICSENGFLIKNRLIYAFNNFSQED